MISFSYVSLSILEADFVGVWVIERVGMLEDNRGICISFKGALVNVICNG